LGLAAALEEAFDEALEAARFFAEPLDDPAVAPEARDDPFELDPFELALPVVFLEPAELLPAAITPTSLGCLRSDGARREYPLRAPFKHREAREEHRGCAESRGTQQPEAPLPAPYRLPGPLAHGLMTSLAIDLT